MNYGRPSSNPLLITLFSASPSSIQDRENQETLNDYGSGNIQSLFDFPIFASPALPLCFALALFSLLIDAAIRATESGIEKLEAIKSGVETEGLAFLERKIAEDRAHLTELETQLAEENRKLNEMYGV